MPSNGPPTVAWRPDDSTVPLQQGDLLLVAWSKTLEPQPHVASVAYPIVGKRDGLHLRFWDSSRPGILEMWGCMNYGLVVVVADDCAIDKEFNILRDQYTADGVDVGEAIIKANSDADPYVAVAEIWPVDVLPEHLQRDARSGAVGYVPFSMNPFMPEEDRTFVVDLSRISTVSWRAIDRRIAMRDGLWRQRLQTQLCRFFAARTARVNEQLAEIFERPVVRAEALTPLAGNPPRTRARLHFEDGNSVMVEAILSESGEIQEPESDRPGLQTRQ